MKRTLAHIDGVKQAALQLRILLCTVGVLVASVVPSTFAVSLHMVTVGNAGNAADTTGFGAVSYDYQIGKHEVTIAQWTEFLNTVALSDPHGLWNPLIDGPDLVSAGIARSGTDGSLSYQVMENPTGQSSANRPATYVSFYDAARFANWMHNGQGTGSTETGAYKLATGALSAAVRSGNVSTYTATGPTNLSIGDQVTIAGFTDGGSLGTRFNVTGIVTALPGPNQFSMVNNNGNAVAAGTGNFTGISATHAPDAKFWIPTENEWYKAAYYDPTLNGGSGGYYDYGTKSDAAPGQTAGNTPNQANWSTGSGYAVGPTPLNTLANYLADVGSYTGSASAYGLFDTTGNVREWTAAIDGNSLESPGSARMWRGGGFNDGASRSMASYRDTFPSAASAEFSSLGFRLAAAVPNAALLGDFNLDGIVDAADYTVWRDNLGGDATTLNGNGDGDAVVDGQDYAIWRNNFGAVSPSLVSSAAVPEPASVIGLITAVSVCALRQHKYRVQPSIRHFSA